MAEIQPQLGDLGNLKILPIWHGLALLEFGGFLACAPTPTDSMAASSITWCLRTSFGYNRGASRSRMARGDVSGTATEQFVHARNKDDKDEPLA